MNDEVCRNCRHAVSEPAELERAIPGLKILSSAYGSVRGETCLCELTDTFTTPERGCADFKARQSGSR